MNGQNATAEDGTGADDIRPVVPTGSSGRWEIWAFAVVLVILGAWLFSALNSARLADEDTPGLVSATPPGARITAPEPLSIPERFAEQEPLLDRDGQPIAPRTDAGNQGLGPRTLPPPAAQQGFPFPPPPTAQAPRFEQLPPAPTPPRVVFDRPPSGQFASPAQPAVSTGDRVTAGRLQNPSFTIPQGTVIPAVLETALDSTRPGGARALVQRDVASWDGTRILIPRGSRLYGEYEAGLRRGENRALVQWTRLIRPDGVTIALDSPSSDPLGRAGIKGKVDGKFWQRFGGALLNSVFDIGVGLAVNEATDGVIVALPGSTQNVEVADTNAIRPTLKVKHGTSVSVFVARDLDFSSVER